jgi:hypothetical protein
MVLVELGFAAEQRGDPDAARTLHAEAFDIAHRMDWPRDATWALEGLAAATMAAGHHDTAARLLGAAAAARRSAALPAAPSDQAEIDRVAARVAAALGAAGFAAASADGEGMTPSQARSLVSPATR